MISRSKAELKDVIASDCAPYLRGQSKGKLILKHFVNHQDIVFCKFLTAMRKETHYKYSKGLHAKILYIIYMQKKTKLGYKLGIEMHGECVGKGIRIHHFDSIVINSFARLGDDCVLRGNNCIGVSRENGSVPHIGNNVDIGYGATIIGDIRIADGVVIGANSLVNKSCETENAVLVGSPAHISLKKAVGLGQISIKNLKITIITITFNSEKTVRKTFESVRRQHYKNLEYLIIDGGSTDSTLDIAAEYDDIITQIISEPDDGISDAMNKGISLSTGDLIGIIHSDDALAEGALDRLSKAWNGKTDIYYGNAVILNENGEPDHILCSNSDLSGMPYGFCLVHPAVFVTKKTYDKYGVFNKNFKCAMDYELLLRFYKNDVKFLYLNEELACFRVGGTNQKYRSRTLDEVCDISIQYGGNPVKAYCIKYKKKLIDIIRPFMKRKKFNSRVEKLPDESDRGGLILNYINKNHIICCIKITFFSQSCFCREGGVV